MAKNNNTAPKSANVSVSPAPSGSLATLAALKAKKEELAKQLAAMNEELDTAQTAVKTEHWGRIATLPEMFGLSNVVEVRSLLSEYLRGLEGGNPLAGSRKPISAVERENIIALLKTKIPVSQISAQTNRSVPSIQAIKKDIGLVKERGATTLSGPAAKFELPAGAALPITPEV